MGAVAHLARIGIVAFVAAVRAAWTVVKDKHVPRRRLFLPAKNNLADDSMNGLAYTVESHGPGGAPVICWEREPVTITADEALAPKPRPRGPEPDDLDEAKAFIDKALKAGSKLARDVIDDARDEGIAKQFFAAAIKRRLLSDNPFEEMKGITKQSNRARDFFITREDALKVIEACPTAEWKLIFALSRFGGLRCPSEHLALTWGDIDFEHGQMHVVSPKTEHHCRKESRMVPIFPELRPYLQAVLDELLADDSFDPKQTRLSELPVITRYEQGSNLGTQLKRIIRFEAATGRETAARAAERSEWSGINGIERPGDSRKPRGIR